MIKYQIHYKLKIHSKPDRNQSKLTVGSRRPYTVIVEGNIGAGKTTFLQPFLKHEKIVQGVVHQILS